MPPASRHQASSRAVRRRPVIGVTGPDRGGEAAWVFTWLGLALAGASARHITPLEHGDLRDLDGLVVGGGADVDPRLYGQDLAPLLQPTAEVPRSVFHRLLDLLLFPLTWLVRQLFARSADERQDKARDALEWQLIDRAVNAGLPVLGICRGAQLLNVYFGGSLHQSLHGFYVETREVRSVRPRKRVVVRPGTRLAGVLGCCERWVNSLHRQAVARLGDGMRVAATDRNGIVQAIEHEVLPFVVGVQWHPEYLPQRHEQRAIFRALVAAARARMGRAGRE
ncbi:MAG TPA: gamma-glutamyl-gamma-aminobutyrate hydrolase family protein [Humisphaera sp.]